MNRIKSLLCLVTLGATFLGGCIVTTDTGDFSVAGNWTVNGKTADAAACTEAGIDRIRVVFWNAGTDVAAFDLTAPCADGAFQTANVFPWGEYETQWQALDASGNTIGVMTERFLFVVQSPTTTTTLAPIDFIGVAAANSFSMALGWSTPDASNLEADCATAGVTTMEYSLTRPDGTTEDMTDIACAGALENADAPLGNYSLLVTGSDAEGNKYWTNTCAFTVVAGANTFRCDSPYTGPAPEPTMAVNFTFGGMACDAAGITALSYTVLDAAGGSMVAGTQNQLGLACVDTFVFDTGLTDGTMYTINVDAEGPGGAKYGADCLVTASIGAASVVCDASMM